MPSDLAFLELPESELVSAYDSCSLAEGYYEQKPMDIGVRGLSVRAVYQQLGALQALGVNIDMNSKLFKALRTIVVTNYSLLMLQGAYRSILKSLEAKTVGRATLETIGMAAAQQWHRIAIAAGAGIGVVSAFKVGEKFGSGDWNLPNVDFSKPSERRKAENALGQLGIRWR